MLLPTLSEQSNGLPISNGVLAATGLKKNFFSRFLSYAQHTLTLTKKGQTPPHFNELGTITFSEHFLSEPHKFNFSAPRVLLESVRGQQPRILQRIKNKFSHRDLLPLCPQLSQSILMICPLNGRLWTLLLTAPVSFASSLSSDE